MTRAALGLAVAAVFAVAPAFAQDTPPTIPVEPPVIKQIVFVGNKTTREHVMRREMILTEGDVAFADFIERSRQGIQDLGLFKSVAIDTVPVEGGVKLVVSVSEKWYILPVPRADANADGQKSYGLSLRWYNVSGYNQTLKGGWVKSDEARENQGTSTSYNLGYDMPFVFDSQFSLALSAGHSATPVSDFGGYVETLDNAGVTLSRAFGTGPRSQGWTGSVSMRYSRQETAGPTAPEPYGAALAPGIGVGYRNLRDYLYSNEGWLFSADLNGAAQGMASDYDFIAVGSEVARYFRPGKRTHQNLNVTAAVGSYFGGPDQYRPSGGNYSLGGSRRLHGYESNDLNGDFFVYSGVEYLHPLWVDWLRGVVSLEAATLGPDATDVGRLYGSAGLGLRVRVTFLVDMEVDLGVAVPVGEAGDLRMYGSKL